MRPSEENLRIVAGLARRHRQMQFHSYVSTLSLSSMKNSARFRDPSRLKTGSVDCHICKSGPVEHDVSNLDPVSQELRKRYEHSALLSVTMLMLIGFCTLLQFCNHKNNYISHILVCFNLSPYYLYVNLKSFYKRQLMITDMLAMF